MERVRKKDSEIRTESTKGREREADREENVKKE